MGLQCAFQPALTGHLSITASFLGPKGDHYRQVSLYIHALYVVLACFCGCLCNYGDGVVLNVFL